MTSKPDSLTGTAQPDGCTRRSVSPYAPDDRTFGMRFTSTPRGARLARRLVAHRLDTWGIPYGSRVHDAIVLVVAELAVNAVRHGHVPGRDFHLRLDAATRPQTVRIEVTDTRAERVPPRPTHVRVPEAEDTGGRGLLLVAGLASRWGWHPRAAGPGKTVWAECVLTPSGRGPSAEPRDLP
ncbi:MULTISPECIES: ATP-binding protein [Streptomyces]|uniref:ATP-binding protein n=1 Tax=Streptomyces salyersiae TaxID=3075530 RepID=A0ABU2RMC5_9ACTN|nr:ATP-binding protein [Streptomyces sp. DSM 41770]MDT0429645.1 ATP-binding protein [Streptomyces sp. DSM 41770]